jgi:hypothetical protein
MTMASSSHDLEQARCERVLGVLVDGGVLSSDGKGFIRAGDVPRRN